MAWSKFQRLTQRIGRRVSRYYRTYPFQANVFTYTIACSAGDACSQILVEKKEFDSNRFASKAAVGAFVYGPLFHHFYRRLHFLLPGVSPRNRILKFVIDQGPFTMFVLLGYFLGSGFLEGQSWENNWNDVKGKLPITYVLDCCFWLPVQYINFTYIPPTYCVAYVSGMTLIWMTFLSFIKNRPKLPTFIVELEDGVKKLIGMAS